MSDNWAKRRDSAKFHEEIQHEGLIEGIATKGPTSKGFSLHDFFSIFLEGAPVRAPLLTAC